MSDWFGVWPVILLTIATVFLPGAVLVSAAGARGLDRLGLAAPTSFGLAGVVAVAAGLIGLPFTPVTFAIATLVTAVVALLVRLFLRRRLPERAAPVRPRRARGGVVTGVVVLAAAIAIPAVLIGRRVLRAFGGPENIAQLFDNVFHLNAVKHIAETQSGSSLTLGNLTEASRGFYPAAMHDLTAVVVQLGDFAVPTAANAMALVIAAAVWPISMIFLVTRVFGVRPAPILLAGVLSSAFGAFPLLLMSWGLVAPLITATAMLPVAVALLIQAFGRDSRRGQSRWTAVLALVPVSAGMALTHPSTIVAASVIASPFVIARIVADVRGHDDARRLRLLVSGAYLLGTVAAFVVARPDLGAAEWSAVESTTASVGAVVTSAPLGLAPTWAVTVLVALGAVVVVRSPRRWWPLLAGYLGVGLLYIVVASFADGPLRDAFSGVWYRDTPRIAALMPVATIPLAVLGGLAVVHGATTLTTRLARRRGLPLRRPARIALAVGTVLAVVFVPLSQGNQLREAESLVRYVYTYSDDARLISPEERELLEEVDAYVPADGVVVGDPGLGASLVYVYSDRTPLAPHIFGLRSPDEDLLLTRWDRVGREPAVCEAIEELNAYWALSFPGLDALGRPAELPGLTDFDAPGIREVARVGDAVLYEATACGPVPQPDAGT
ncbi:DUF6541 family protein [Microbacterium sp. cf332]|uniref:DUF6541 family protein n=1 Tax=Microbacterium sp. cf332 TaxID=1761804 RepID=UPI000891B8B5|nr:DUF6541 family protein [Microbacterium sp. cf332]SDQ79390.1 hypothetical protein SAMN04487847_2514 [Microbacterium sp. cf332]